jgi:hypothetical protein
LHRQQNKAIAAKNGPGRVDVGASAVPEPKNSANSIDLQADTATESRCAARRRPQIPLENIAGIWKTLRLSFLRRSVRGQQNVNDALVDDAELARLAGVLPRGASRSPNS